MTAPIGPERAHFGGVDGAICVTRGSKTTWYWECIHCKWRIGGKGFQNSKARVHLSGNAALRSRLISQLCDKAPEHVKEQFTKLEIRKRKEKIAKSLNRKRAVELLTSSPQLATRWVYNSLQCVWNRYHVLLERLNASGFWSKNPIRKRWIDSIGSPLRK